MAPFSFPTNHQVVFLFTSKTSFKHKQELRDLLVKHGATVSYIVTRKTSLVIAESADVITDNYKIKQALKLGIPIVSLNFLDDCIQRQKYLDPSMYLLAAPVKKDEKFDNGQIKAPPRQKKTFSAKTYLLRPDNLPVYQLQDNNCPSFDEPRLIKAALFQKQDDDIHPSYQVLELQNSRDENRRYKYRVSTQLAQSSKYGTLKVAPMMYRFTEDADSALLVYSSLYMKYSNTGYSEVWQVPAGVISQLGSKLFHEWFQQNMYSSSVDDEVAQVVETMWLEAVGSVEEKISIPVSHLKLSEVEKAETDLRRLQEAMKKKMVKSEIEPLKEEYYQHLPHKEEYKMELNTVRDICVEKDMCQVIKDVIAISESTDWSTKVSSLSRFNALHCHIQTLPKCDSSFRELTYLIHGDDRGLKKVKIHNIFKVCRFTEEKQFQDLGNKQLLFHGSKIQNYVGLLSRGLLLPQTIVEDYGVERSDVGNLGFGVYFSDSAQASLKYTTRSNIKGSTFLLVSEVALGDVHHTKTRMLDLKAPPGGFNSVHGVKSSATEKTDFKDDEYAVYDIHQQRIRYLIELSLPEEELHQVPVTLTDSESDETEQEETEKDTDIDITDIRDVASPLSKVDVGLCADGNKKIPLKSVHIRARLVDLAAEVVVLQQYYNDNNRSIEAKYVFPLDDNAAVCGFEAFINGKHIIGTVKEKQQAHQEYKEAISKGHGAYLMDEEKADVFTVRVGNLPPKASVLIKITYVAELQMNGELIDFYLPGSVASWDKHVALSEVIQTDLEAVNVTKGDVVTTVQVAMEMPFDIRTIESPTHKIKMKKTATKAVVELPKNATLGEGGFRLQVGLSQIHVPRMWVEKHPELESQACMLTFYPEFEADSIPDPRVIFLIDCSNSMKGEAMIHAQKLVLLALEMLPKMCHFNIIAFGTTYRELYQKADIVTEKSTKEAKNFVKSLTATRGNTNVWSSIEMMAMLPSEGHLHNIYLVSDGHLNNLDSLLKLINDNRMVNRIFTLSVGSVADLYVMKTVAKIGGGSSQHYNPSMKSKWQYMLQDQLLKASQPSLTAVQVEWQQLDDNCKAPVQAPKVLMSLYNGQREVVYGFVQHCTMAALKAEINGAVVSTMVSTHELNITTGKILHRLTARAVIRDWQSGLLAPDKIEHEMIKVSNKSNVIDLSKEYSLVTPFTSFVAIEERIKGETPKDGPSIEELVSKEKVDILEYMVWQITVEEEMPTDKKMEHLLKKATIAESYSVLEASRLYEKLEHLLPELMKAEGDMSELKEKVHQKLYTFYKEVAKDETKAQRFAPELYAIKCELPPRRNRFRCLDESVVQQPQLGHFQTKIKLAEKLRKETLFLQTHECPKFGSGLQSEKQASNKFGSSFLFGARKMEMRQHVFKSHRIRGQPMAEGPQLSSPLMTEKDDTLDDMFQEVSVSLRGKPTPFPHKFTYGSPSSAPFVPPKIDRSLGVYGQDSDLKQHIPSGEEVVVQSNFLLANDTYNLSDEVLADKTFYGRDEVLLARSTFERSPRPPQRRGQRGSVASPLIRLVPPQPLGVAASPLVKQPLAASPPLPPVAASSLIKQPPAPPLVKQSLAAPPPPSLQIKQPPALALVKQPLAPPPPPRALAASPLIKQPPAPPLVKQSLAAPPPPPPPSLQIKQPPAPALVKQPLAAAPPPPPVALAASPLIKPLLVKGSLAAPPPPPPPPMGSATVSERLELAPCHPHQLELSLLSTNQVQEQQKAKQKKIQEKSDSFEEIDENWIPSCGLFGDEEDGEKSPLEAMPYHEQDKVEEAWYTIEQVEDEDSYSDVEFDCLGDEEYSEMSLKPEATSFHEQDMVNRDGSTIEAVKDEEEDLMTSVLQDLIQLNRILKEKRCLLQQQQQQPIFSIHLDALETNMKECLDAISQIKGKKDKYGHPAPPENIWTSVFYSEMTLSKESGLRSLFGMKQDIFWCPSEDLGRLIGVNFDGFRDILIKAGLRSLGVKAETEVMQYVATIFALLSILRLTSDICHERLSKYIDMNLQMTDILVQQREQSVVIGVRKTGEAILESKLLPDVYDLLSETVHWLMKQDDKYPSVDAMLELSATKVTIILQMFQALLMVKEAEEK